MLGQRSPRRRTKNGGITAQQIKPSVHAQPPIGEPLHTMPLTDKEDATMKKKTLSILSLCIALFAAFALVGCGGSASGGRQRRQEREQGKSPRCQEDRLYLV